MSSRSRSRHEGIEVRHQKSCRAATGGERCSCRPSYRAEVFSQRDGRKIRKTFGTLADARVWRTEAQAALRRGTLRAPAAVALAGAAEAWLCGARDGSVRNRSGDVYKPSAIRGYEQALRLRVLPALGTTRLTSIERADLQALVDRLLAAGHEPSTIRNTLLPVQATEGMPAFARC